MKTLMARKLPLNDLLDVLHQLYDDGADYVDFITEATMERDVLSIVVRDEYVNVEYTAPKKLTDDDLNQLI